MHLKSSVYFTLVAHLNTGQAVLIQELGSRCCWYYQLRYHKAKAEFTGIGI